MTNDSVVGIVRKALVPKHGVNGLVRLVFPKESSNAALSKALGIRSGTCAFTIDVPLSELDEVSGWEQFRCAVQPNYKSLAEGGLNWGHSVAASE